MVHPSCEGTDDALHLQGEEEGRELGYGKRGLRGKLAERQVVDVTEGIDYELFITRKVGEELPLYTLLTYLSKLTITLPSHGADHVGSRCDEHCPVVAYQIITSLRILGPYRTWKGEDVTMVGLGYPCRDESATPVSTLHQYACV